MQHRTSVCLGLMLAAAVAMPALAQQAPVKIGMVTTLSGPGGYLGQDIRDAFKLAIDLGGGKLGGAPVELVVEDDALKPGQGKQIAEKMLKTDGIKIMT
uniref:ABC transporter substrate-binding protein n=1 Tax=Streptomyces niveiscabiei TaxID=164115 RepID=UPI0038F73D74